jgi:hypothetical protein
MKGHVQLLQDCVRNGHGRLHLNLLVCSEDFGAGNIARPLLKGNRSLDLRARAARPVADWSRLIGLSAA